MTLSTHELLDLSDLPANRLAWHTLLTAGLPASSLKAVAKHMGLAERRLQEMMGLEGRSAKAPLTREASNQLYRVVRALGLASPLFADDLKKAGAFLTSPQPRLRDQVPIEMLRTHHGSEYVFTFLDRTAQEKGVRP